MKLLLLITNRLNFNVMKKIFFSFLVFSFSTLAMAQNIAVSAITGDWWSQLGQDANLPTTDGWYYRTIVGSERLAFDGTLASGTRIATTFGSIGAPYTGISIKFDATMPASESGLVTNIILGSNAVWGGQGILIEFTGYGIRAVKNFDYGGNLTWIDTSAEYKTALGAGGLIAGNEINISPTGLITLKLGTYTSPNSYQADVAVLANTFVMVCPGATGFKFKNVIAKKGAVAKSYFPNYSYSITASANNALLGSISGTGAYDKTSDVTLTATPTSGNRFVNWTENAVEISKSPTLPAFSATAPRTLVANFASNAVSVSNLTNASSLGNCETCDVTIANGGTLTIDASKTVSSLIVEPGAKVNSLTVNLLTVTGDLTLKADKTTSPSVKVKTALSLTGNLTLQKTIDNSKWYFMSFPSNVLIADIVKLSGSGTLGELGTNWWIKYYDGATRVSNLGTTSNWVNMPANGTLEANKGYIIGLANSLTGDYVLSFPLSKSLVNVAEPTRTVAVVNHGEGSVAPQHVGWNLVGSPYLSSFAGSSVGAGYLTFHNGTTYTQLTNTAVSSINTFSAFFVQASTAGTGANLSFATAGRQSAKSLVETSTAENYQLNVTTATGSDNTTLILDEAQTVDYTINRDLEKWLTTETNIPQVYTRINDTRLAFNALSTSDLNNLALGIYTKTAGRATITLQKIENATISEFLLTDIISGNTIDLMKQNYGYDAAAGTDDARFKVSVRKIATASSINKELGSIQYSVSNKMLTLSNLNEGSIVRIYDATGRIISNKVSNGNTINILLPANGIYNIQLQRTGKTIVTKLSI